MACRLVEPGGCCLGSSVLTRAYQSLPVLAGFTGSSNRGLGLTCRPRFGWVRPPWPGTVLWRNLDEPAV